MIALYDLATKRSIYPAVSFVIFIAICITDLTDGIAARKFDAVSKNGGLFDVAADFFYIVSSVVLLIGFHQLPFWFLLVILINFMEFIITSKIILNRRFVENKAFVFDSFGRAAAVLFFVLPGLICLLNIVFVNLRYDFTYLLIVVITLLAIISAIVRLCFAARIALRREDKSLRDDK